MVLCEHLPPLKSPSLHLWNEIVVVVVLEWEKDNKIYVEQPEVRSDSQ